MGKYSDSILQLSQFIKSLKTDESVIIFLPLSG